MIKETLLKLSYIVVIILVWSFLLLWALNVSAWQLSWDAVPEAEGYRVSYKQLVDTDYVSVDTGTNNSLNLDSLSLAEGTRYEFYVQGYAGTPQSFSGESNHIRWTYPSPPIIVEMMGAPVNIVITP